MGKKKKLRDIIAANKWFILSIIMLVLLPIGLLGLTLGLYIDKFSLGTWDLVNILLIIFLGILSLELILAIIYVATFKKRETLQEIKQEMKIEESGHIFELEREDTEKDLVDSKMREVIMKKNFVLMTRQEIIDFCKTLNYNLETEVELRQYNDSPDNISAGNKIYCFLYETQGVIKLMVKNNSFYIDVLKVKHPNIEQVGKVSDWYEILLDDTFTDNEEVKDILVNSYEFVVAAHYSLVNGTYIMKGELKHSDPEVEKIVIQSAKEPDEKVEAILEKKQKLSELTLTTRENISDYAEKNIKGSCAAFVIRRKGFALYSLKALNPKDSKSRAYGLLYERENVVKMWLRLDPEFARSKMKIHPTLGRAKFPKGRDWYAMVLDETFDEDIKISELIWEAYNYTCEEYFKIIRIE